MTQQAETFEMNMEFTGIPGTSIDVSRVTIGTWAIGGGDWASSWGPQDFEVAHMKRVVKIASITSNQPPYSMINRNIEREILPFCQQHHIGTINYAPMHSGLLACGPELSRSHGRCTTPPSLRRLWADAMRSRSVD